LHDIATLDARGISGCIIATEEFKQAAAAQASALGFEPSVVWVPHPIQNLSPDELKQLASSAVDRALAACTPV
jgi:hypothetical protein